MSKIRAIITGMGVVSCIGNDVASFWGRLIEGRAGIREISRFDVSSIRFHRAGEVDLPMIARETGDLATDFALHACRQALEHSGVAGRCRPAEIHLVLGSNFGPLDVQVADWEEKTRPTAYRKSRAPVFDAAAEAVRDRLGLAGPAWSLSLSCASGNAAIGYGVDLIRNGMAKAVLVCGYDALHPYSWAGLTALRTVTADEVRPFDRRRNGTIFSEGAGALVLEARGLSESSDEALVEVAGHFENNNAFHLAHPDRDASGLARAIRGALADAGIPPEAVDHINAHGTGTRHNDPSEMRALRAVFGEGIESIPVTSIKATVGHGMGAASAFEAIACVMTIREGIAPPTLNCEELDPECAGRIVRGAPLEGRFDVVLSNSAGIGGGNAVAVFRRAM